MSHKQGLQLVIVVILITSFLVGCAGSASTAGSETPTATSVPEQMATTSEPPTATSKPPTVTPRVFFTAPTDGATVASPVHIAMQAENFIIEPAGERKPGVGHLHIIVDAECIKPGQDIPKDETHLHYGEGQLEADLDLTPGTHTLCLQAGDGYHIALRGEGMTQQISIAVK